MSENTGSVGAGHWVKVWSRTAVALTTSLEVLYASYVTTLTSLQTRQSHGL